jgi:hypothetical protein
VSPLPYMLPLKSNQFPRGFSLTQFIQTVFVGISGLPGPLVFPKWQPEPPEQPDITVNWMSIGFGDANPDANSYIGVQEVEASGQTIETQSGLGLETEDRETLETENDSTITQVISQRHETLEIQCSIYGPEAFETYNLLLTGFQIPPNLYALRTANMGFVEVTRGRRVPDLVNQRWVNRIETSVFLRRQIQQVYPILTLISATGVIYVPDINENYELVWNVA